MDKETVLITGSSNGLGKELAILFAEKGHNIWLHGRNKEMLEKVLDEVSKKDVDCNYILGDLISQKTITELSRIKEYQRVSVLINNAAEDCPKKAFEGINESDIERIIKVNLTAPILLSNEYYKYFLETGRGTIININSLAGREAQKFRTLYGAAKYGLRGFTETLQIEAEKNNVRVIGIYPGRIKKSQGDSYGLEYRNVAERIYSKFQSEDVNDLLVDNRLENG
jgi:short-subunit dehydrogenase